jgi:two-component system KDP operon response regulator KdpE
MRDEAHIETIFFSGDEVMVESYIQTEYNRELSMQNKKRVLLVDDNPKVMRFIEIALKLNGFESTTAASGLQALEKVNSEEFDIILLDVRMPDVDGFEVLHRLRKFSQMPVIAYSATPEFCARALECGADAFIAKPFDIDVLIRKSRELLAPQQ